MTGYVDTDLWAFLEDCAGLHRWVELHYTVDGYEAVLMENDGNSEAARAWAPTIREAVEALRAGPPYPRQP